MVAPGDRRLLHRAPRRRPAAAAPDRRGRPAPGSGDRVEQRRPGRGADLRRRGRAPAAAATAAAAAAAAAARRSRSAQPQPRPQPQPRAAAAAAAGSGGPAPGRSTRARSRPRRWRSSAWRSRSSRDRDWSSGRSRSSMANRAEGRIRASGGRLGGAAKARMARILSWVAIGISVLVVAGCTPSTHSPPREACPRTDLAERAGSPVFFSGSRPLSSVGRASPW